MIKHAKGTVQPSSHYRSNAVDLRNDSVVTVALGNLIHTMKITKANLFDFFGNHPELSVYDIKGHMGSQYGRRSYTLFSESNLLCSAESWILNIRLALSEVEVETIVKRYEVFINDGQRERFNATLVFYRK